jgi:hypothetical protein
MRKIIAISILLFSGLVNAHAPFPNLCKKEDLRKLKAIWTDMEKSGFDQARDDRGIGISVGDCTVPYSLETIAQQPHKMDAPGPYCGVIFTLSYDEALAAEQATWILDTVGTVYKTQAGISIRLCAKMSEAGPSPGVTVHN